MTFVYFARLLFAGLDKALFTIASNYVQSQNQRRPGGLNQRATWWNKKGKMPTDPSQWKYCELCKMTCPGLQVKTYQHYFSCHCYSFELDLIPNADKN
jgi:hypothetical protein